jgi:LPXTG-site transpeptidase (sortase) family protein
MKRSFLTWLGSALVIGGATLLGSYFWLQRQADEAQLQARQQLNSMITHRTPHAPKASLRHRMRYPSRGDVVGEITIPRLHLAVVVFEGDDEGILKVGAGHIPGTALPGQSGNVGIAAHCDTYFRLLRRIHPNDEIVLKTVTDTTYYAATNTEIVPPSETEVLATAPGWDLTLVTCYPFNYVGSAPKRFTVHAHKIG